MAKTREAKRAASDPAEEVHLSLAVQQFNLPPYLLIKGLFADYQELTLQFAYCTLFIVSAPPIALLSFGLNYLEIRIDGTSRVTSRTRKPLVNS